MDVAIAGVGAHPFGRFATSAKDMANVAAQAALADADVTWPDIGFAAGSSRDGGHADALVADFGLTGTPFLTVYNGCATGGSALMSAATRRCWDHRPRARRRLRQARPRCVRRIAGRVRDR